MKLLVRDGWDAFRQMGQRPVSEWLNVELPRTQAPRVDLLGRKTDGGLLHIELQSNNDALMALRMAEYALAIVRWYGEYPEQIVLYVGNDRILMRAGMRSKGMTYRYRLLDIRQLDADALLASNRISDNIISVLAGMRDTAAGLRKILQKVVKLRKRERMSALHRLLIICGIRRLSWEVEEELHTVPVTFDLTEDPYIHKLVEKWKQDGWQQGLQKGTRDLVLLQLRKRFGRLPAAVRKKISAMNNAEVSDLAVRVLDANSLSELFG